MEGRRYSQELGCGASRSVSGAPAHSALKLTELGLNPDFTIFQTKSMSFDFFI